MPSWIIALTPLWAAICGGIIVGIFRLVERFRGEKQPPPPTWPEMWAQIKAQDERIDLLEERIRVRDQAFLSLVSTFAESWPSDVPRPEFDPNAITVLEDTLPAWFFQKHRRPRPSTT